MLAIYILEERLFRYIALTLSIYNKNVLFSDKFNFLQFNLFVQDVIFIFTLLRIKIFRNNSFHLTDAIVNHKPRSFTQDCPIFGFIFDTIYSLYVKNILLAEKLLIFSHNNLFAQDVIFALIQFNSKQIILSSYQSNRQPQTNHKPPEFWILFLILI